MVGVFLDQISNFARLPEDGRSKSESWRYMMVQPVRLPDIEHIHVSMNLSTSAGKNVSLWYPDGSVALELREQISRQVQIMVKNVNVDHDDVCEH